MKNLFYYSSLFFLKIFLILILYFFFSVFIPYPLSQINIIFVSLVLFLMKNEKGSLVWVAWFVFFVLELYLTYPFGVVISSGTFAFLFSYWFYKYIFTNRTWYSSVGLVIVMIVIYRLIFVSLLMLYHLNSGINVVVWSNALLNFGLEIIFSTIITGILFMILSPYIENFQSQRIFSSWLKNIRREQ